MMLSLGGIVIGLLGAAAFTRYLEGMLFNVSPLDPSTFITVSFMFAAVAMRASYLPVRRAMRVDPCIGLRRE